MNFLLDTDVISEWTKARPDAGVVAWLAGVDEDRVFVSVATIAELRHGLERMPTGARRDRLDSWLTEQLSLRFEARILRIDVNTANAYGRMMARGQSSGRPMGTMDAFIAATAEQHDLILVTRNTSDFEVLGIRLFSPWKGG